MIQFILRKIFGSKNDRELRTLWPRIQEINALEPTFERMTNEELMGQTAKFKNRLAQGEPLDNLLHEAFATVREASKRVLGMRHFDVQMIGGMVLHSGKIAEMKTGEGKTLCGTLPVYLNALTGKGVHVVTVNDYLARRDAEWMGTIYAFLGLTTGVILGHMDPAERVVAYGSDITYGQNNEFGFDYLRDNMKLEVSEMVQRGHNFAIVDEVDSILVDEARTPLIISGPSEDPTEKYQIADQMVRGLQADVHYALELKSKQVLLTDEGVRRIEEILKVDNLYDPRNIDIVHHITQALKAHVTMKLDVDYVVRNDQVVIVDEFTGRLMAGRRWSDGLHQAVEAKEGVTIARESQTLATITFQNYFRMYQKLAGMTGTADTEAVEFKKIYKLDVVLIPTNMPMVRADHTDVVFATEKGKFKAVCDEIADCYERGQPVLVGTASIAKSEVLSGFLERRGIPHHVLNAKQHEREAEIVAQAGRFKAVTISTNMAGRGTDIVLGGNAEFMAASQANTRDHNDPNYQTAYENSKALCAEERAKVLEAGGLHITGTERHESRRIDNQLRGRSGRQGDPGSSRFFISLEDDLMKRFGGERMQAIMARVGMTDDDAIEGGLVGSAIERAQKKVEGHHFDIRKQLLEYDDVLNKQREVIYTQRARILRANAIEEEFLEMIPDVVQSIIESRASDRIAVENWDINGMFDDFGRLFGMKPSAEDFLAKQEKSDQKLAQEIFENVVEQMRRRYEERKARFGAGRMLMLERIVLLQAMDHFWKEHLQNMDHLKEGIFLRGYSQKNPLHEYQREAFDLFTQAMITIREAVIQNIFIPELPSEAELREMEEAEKERQRQREAAAKSIHQDVIEGAGQIDPIEAARLEGLNREQRRKQQAIAKASTYTPQTGDFAPTPVAQGVNAKSRRDAERKKAKAARKARKKNR